MTGPAVSHGGELALAVARAHGVNTVFTLSGGHVFPLYDAAVCTEPTLRLVDVRHEQTAVFAAEAVGKLTGRPGLAVVTAGPGVTNAVSGIAQASFAGSPLVVLGGRAPTPTWGRDALQKLDHPPLIAPLARLAETVSSVERIADRVPAVMVVANNSGWGLERHPMQQLYGYHVAADLAPGTRYDDVVKALGVDGETVSDPRRIGPALDRAFASSVPYLVNVLTDPDVAHLRQVAYPRQTTGV